VCRIGRENESADVIPQQKEDVVRTRNAWTAAVAGPVVAAAAAPSVEKTLINP